MSNPVRTWSPNTGEDKIPQLYLRIPKKQQELLDHEDAWTSAKVPREVLEDLQRLIVVKPVPEVSFPAPAAEKVTMPPPEPPTQRTPRKEDPAPEPSLRGSSRSQRQNQVDAEDAGTQISWSPSPARSLRRQSPANEEPSPGPPLSITASSSPPPSYRPQHQALSKAVYLEMQTSSSVVSAEDEPPEMTGDSEEVAVPAPAAVAALAFPEPTPPSAQLIIPCTFTEGSSARPSGVQRKQLMKSVASKFSPESHRPSGLLEPAEISSNSPPWPASRVPGSSPPRPPPVDPFSSIPQTFTSASGPPLSGASGRALSKPSVETEQAQSSALYTIPPNGPVSQVPLTAFMLAYPDYRCSLSNFIRGVKVIQDVRNKKRFPVFLYDDLLRVFCGDYTDYIAALGPNEKPLTVVQWYVDNVSRPLYQKGILTKENLDSVLANHPEHDRDPSAQNPHARDFEQVPEADVVASVPSPPITSLSSNPKPRPSAAVSVPREIHVDELADDPIEITENTQPTRQLRFPSPDLSTVAPQTPLLPFRRTRRSRSPDDVEFVTARNLTQPSSREAKRRRTVEDCTPVPETLLRPRDTNRPRVGTPMSTASKRRRVGSETPQEREARWREHVAKRLQAKGSTPKSSMGPG